MAVNNKSVRYFQFWNEPQKMVTVFYSNIESAVINNGFATNWFKLSKGVRQGCPLSPCLFILSAEMLSNKIRQSRDIKGITIFGNEIKISQFADDTNFFCDNVTSAEKSLKTVNDFTDISGLRLNTKKTKAIWLGKWSANKSTPLNVKWLRCPVKVLGVYISYDEKKNDAHNSR